MKKVIFGIFSMILILASCMRDKFEPVETVCGVDTVTYDADIAPLIQETCAYVGCHTGIGQQDRYSSYAELQDAITTGNFFNEVLETRDMPPSYDIEVPTVQLTDDQYNLFACWAEAGYPEK